MLTWLSDDIGRWQGGGDGDMTLPIQQQPPFREWISAMCSSTTRVAVVAANRNEHIFVHMFCHSAVIGRGQLVAKAYLILLDATNHDGPLSLSARLR